MKLKRQPITLDVVKPPCNIFRSGATARGAAVIEQAMALTDTFQNGPLLRLTPVALIGRRQYLHFFIGRGRSIALPPQGKRGMTTTTTTPNDSAAPGHDAARLPTRAVNLARRALQVERDANGRARVTIELIMIDGQWLITVMRPGKLEHLSE